MKRKKLWKRALAVLLCTAITAGLGACGGNTETAETEQAAAESTAGETETQAGEEREVITLTIMGETGSDGISTDDAIGQYIKDKLGIVLEYTAASSDRLKVMAAGGDLPDIVELHESGSLLTNLIDSGSLWAMDDWLESNGENIKSKMPVALKYAKEVVGGGQTYFLPAQVQIANPDLPSKNGYVGFFTRWDYYKELGCPEITNEDEYLDVLKQMVDAHPETADGKKVYALSGFIDWGLWPYTISYPFSHGYTNLSNNQLCNQVTGELEDMFTLEDGIFWKALAFFNKAYRMGIMDPEAFTMKNAQYQEKIENGEVLVSAYNWGQPITEICGENAANYILPGAFPYAASIYPINSDLGYQMNNCLVISSNCKYPERAMELLEFMNSDEGARLVRTGIQGEDWDYVDGVPKLIGKREANFTSNNEEEEGYADPSSPQGIGKYRWLSSLCATNSCEDGYPIDLTKSKEYNEVSVTAADQDFCEYYTDGEATYPGEVYVGFVEDGSMKTVDDTDLATSLMAPVSDEAAKVFAKADEYFQANIAKIITCKDDAEFEEQKDKMISDVLAMGYEDALSELQEQFEIAKKTAEVFK